MLRPHPLESIKRLREITDSVIVSFSRGKDSLVALDLCKKHFNRVEAFYCYMVPGLEFEERSLRYYERRWSISIHRKPDWMLSSWLKAGQYRIPNATTTNLPKMSEAEMFDHMREVTGLDWIVTGRKADDSLWRRSTCARQPDGIFEKRREAWPLVWWTNQAVLSYLKRAQIPLPGDYLDCHSSHGMNLATLTAIKKRYPDDYRRITEYFPYIGAETARAEFRKGWGAEDQPVSELHHAADSPERAEERPLESTHDQPEQRQEAAGES